MRQVLLKQRQLLVTGALLAALVPLLAGCLTEDKPQPTPPPGTPTTAINPTAGATSEADQPNAQQPDITPIITLAVNSSRKAEVFQGWPIIIETSLAHPDAMRPDIPVVPLVVGTADHPWSEAVRVEVVDEAGNEQSWPISMANLPDGAVTLDSDNVSSIYWSLAAEQTANLKEGVYALTAFLDTTRLPSGWKGTADSVSATLSISKAPDTLSAEQESLKARLMANEALLRGDTDRAASYIDAQLAKDPKDIGALELKGDMMAEAGQTNEALQLYSQAINIFIEKNPDTEEPPFDLISKQHEMLDKMLDEEQP